MRVRGLDDRDPPVAAALPLRDNGRRRPARVERRPELGAGEEDEVARSRPFQARDALDPHIPVALERASESLRPAPGPSIPLLSYAAWAVLLSFRTAASSAPQSRMTNEKEIQRRKKMIEVSVPARSLERTMPTAEKLAT